MSATPRTGGMTLREAMGGARGPDLEIQVPPGRRRRRPDDEDLRSREQRLSERLPAEGRFDLFPALRELLHDSHRVMTRERVGRRGRVDVHADLYDPGARIAAAP